MRDCAMPSVSAAASTRAAKDHCGDNPSRRARGYTQASSTRPAIAAGMRRPKGVSPKMAMPAAMANLPISGWGQETSLPGSHLKKPCGPSWPRRMVRASLP